MTKNIYIKYGVIYLIVVVILSLIIKMIDIPLLMVYLLAINLTTFLMYFIDKLAAKKAYTRTPEMILHLATLVGGTAGAFLGQRVFKHKTLKSSFQVIFWLITVLQLVVLITVFYLQQK